LSEQAQTTAGFCVNPRTDSARLEKCLFAGTSVGEQAGTRGAIPHDSHPDGPKTAEMGEPVAWLVTAKRLFPRSSTSLPRRAHGDEAWTSARERPETPYEMVSAKSLLCQTQGVTPRSGSTRGRSRVDRAVRRCRSRSTRGGHARSMSGRGSRRDAGMRDWGTGSTAGTPSAAGFEDNPTVLSPFGLRVGRDRVHPRQLAV
jgi:hypothetical protein